MRVAIVSPYGLEHPGGVQDQAKLLRDWLTDTGHEAWVVAPGSGPGWRSAGDVVAFRANRSVAPVAVAPRAVTEALQAVDGADVVHIHEPLMPVVSLGLVVRCQLPLVGTFHADPSRLIRRLYRVAGSPLRRVVRRLQVVTAVSPTAADAIGAFSEPRLIPNGIDVAAHRVDEERRPHRVVFVGRDEPRKGLSILLSAWEAVRVEIPEAELFVISDTPRSAADGVRYLGRVDQGEKRRLLASAAVLCAPNTGGESFGLVVAEGMAAGCTVVASGLAAFVAVLGDTGLYAKPGDAADLARQLISALSDEEGAASLGHRARERVERFDKSAVGAGYLEAYGDAVAAFVRTSGR